MLLGTTSSYSNFTPPKISAGCGPDQLQWMLVLIVLTRKSYRCYTVSTVVISCFKDKVDSTTLTMFALF